MNLKRVVLYAGSLIIAVFIVGTAFSFINRSRDPVINNVLVLFNGGALLLPCALIFARLAYLQKERLILHTLCVALVGWLGTLPLFVMSLDAPVYPWLNELFYYSVGIVVGLPLGILWGHRRSPSERA